MKTGTIVGVLAVGGLGYLLYRNWKKSKLAVAAVTPPLQMPIPSLVPPALTAAQKALASELGISEYTVRKFLQVM